MGAGVEMLIVMRPGLPALHVRVIRRGAARFPSAALRMHRLGFPRHVIVSGLGLSDSAFERITGAGAASGGDLWGAHARAIREGLSRLAGENHAQERAA
jgi:hypothetical protein